MNLHALDNGLKTAFDAINLNSYTNLVFDNDSKKHAFIIELLISSLIEHKSTLIITSSHSSIEFIKRYLAKFKLSSLILQFEHDATISEQDIAKLRLFSKAKYTPELKYKHKFEVLSGKLNQAKKEIIGQLNYAHSFKENLHQLNLVDLKSKSIECYEEIDQDLFLKLKKHYLSEFNILEKGDPFKQNFYGQIGTDKETIPQVRNLLEAVKTLKHKARLLEINIKKEYKVKIENQFINAKAHAKIVSVFIEENNLKQLDDKGSLVSKFLSKADKTPLDPIENSIQIIKSFLGYDFEVKTKEELEELFNFWKDNHQVIQDEMLIGIEAFINQLNCRNHEMQELLELNQLLNELCDTVNATAFFKEKIENNAWNYKGQLVTVKKLTQTLGNANLLLDKADYVYWRILMNELNPLQRNYFDEIKNHPKDEWLEIDQNSSLLHRNQAFTAHKCFDSQSLLYYDQIKQDLFQLLPLKIENDYAESRTDYFKKFEKTNKSLYNQLFRKSQSETIKWNSFWEKGPALLQALFPICCTKQDFLVKYSNKDFDQIIFLDAINDQNKRLATKIASKIIDLSPTDVDKNDDQTLNIFGAFPLLLTTHQEEQDQIQMVKEVASYLRSLNFKLDFYQSKDLLVASGISEMNTNFIINQFTQHNIKKLPLLNEHEDLIEEMILMDMPHKIILTEDLLLNPLTSETFEWQNVIIKKLADFGFTILDINTIAFAKGGTDLIAKNLLKAIGNTNQISDKDALISA